MSAHKGLQFVARDSVATVWIFKIRILVALFFLAGCGDSGGGADECGNACSDAQSCVLGNCINEGDDDSDNVQPPDAPLACASPFAEEDSCNTEAGTTYYVSASLGADINDGLSEDTPLETIEAVNNLALNPGDHVLFHCGDTWDVAQLLIRHSGEECAHIVYSTYPYPCDDGAAPTLSGRRFITEWSDQGDNIWRANLSEGAHSGLFPRGINQLFQGGSRLPMGVWPNPGQLESGFSYIDTHSSATITDSDLPDADWSQAIFRIRTVRWLLLNYQVASAASGQLTLSDSLECYADTCGAPDSSSHGFGYQLTNHLATLDREGEWHFDAYANQVYLYGTEAPSDISGSVIADWAGDDDTSFPYSMAVQIGNNLAEHVHHVIIEGLRVEGFFGSGIGYPVNLELDENYNVTIRCNRIENVNARGIGLATWVWNAGDDSDWYGGRELTVSANVIFAPNHFGIVSYARGSLFDSNVITDVGMLSNLTKSGLGCEVSSANCTENGDGIHLPVSRMDLNSYNISLQYNSLRRIAYCGFDIFGNNISVDQNFIEHACYTKGDCGSVRTFGREGDNPAFDITLTDNLFVSPIGEVGGGGPGFDTPMAFGLYIDHGSQNVTSTGNSIIDAPSAGILYQNSDGIIEDNLLFNAPNETAPIAADGATVGDNTIASDSSPAGAEVFYNNSSVPLTIPLAGTYTTLDGTAAGTEITLEAFDAMVLISQ